MAVIRVEKKKNYVVMAKFHLRDKRLSLKAKGMMSFLLALPDDWEYTIEGLVTQLKDGITAVRAALKELEACGYMKIGRERDKAGRLRGAVYTIYEKPAEETAETPAAQGDKPNAEKAKQGAPIHEKPTCEKQRWGNRRQLNIDRLNNNIQSNKPLSNDLLSKDSCCCYAREETPKASHGKRDVPSTTPSQNSEEKERDDKEFAEVVRAYCDNLEPAAGQMVLEQLADVYDQYGKKWCLEAIRETVLYGGRSVRYVTRILERWARDGFQATKKGQRGEKVTPRTNAAQTSAQSLFEDAMKMLGDLEKGKGDLFDDGEAGDGTHDKTTGDVPKGIPSEQGGR